MVSSISIANQSWQSVCWAEEIGYFCAVSDNGTSYRVQTSTDGTTWNSNGGSISYAWKSVCWSPKLNMFCAVGNNGGIMTGIMNSGTITWTTYSSSPTTSNNWRGVCWSPERGIFCAVSSTVSSPSGNSNKILTSDNGTTWTVTSVNSIDYGWQSCIWVPSSYLFYAVGDGGQIMTSPNASTWTLQTSNTSNNLSSICWAPELGINVAVANSGTNRVSTNTISSYMNTPTNINSYLYISGNTLINSPSTFASSLTISGNTTLNSALNVSGTSNHNGASTFNSTLYVHNTTLLRNSVTVQSSIDVNSSGDMYIPRLRTTGDNNLGIGLSLASYQQNNPSAPYVRAGLQVKDFGLNANTWRTFIETDTWNGGGGTPVGPQNIYFHTLDLSQTTSSSLGMVERMKITNKTTTTSLTSGTVQITGGLAITDNICCSTISIMSSTVTYDTNRINMYPPIVLTSNSQTISHSYCNGTVNLTYSADWSSTNIYYLFNRLFGPSITDYLSSTANKYATSDPFTYNGGLADYFGSSFYIGVWVKVTFPEAFIPKHIGLFFSSSTTYGKNYKIFASNNSTSTATTDWTVIVNNETTSPAFTSVYHSFELAGSTAYSSYLLIVNSIKGGAGQLRINEFLIYGNPPIQTNLNINSLKTIQNINNSAYKNYVSSSLIKSNTTNNFNLITPSLDHNMIFINPDDEVISINNTGNKNVWVMLPDSRLYKNTTKVITIKDSNGNAGTYNIGLMGLYSSEKIDGTAMTPTNYDGTASASTANFKIDTNYGYMTLSVSSDKNWSIMGGNYFNTIKGIGSSSITVGSNLSVLGYIKMKNENDIYFRNIDGDINHGIGFYGYEKGNFAGVGVNGPVVYGAAGGMLGTRAGNTETKALTWSTAGVDITGNLTLNGYVRSTYPGQVLNIAVYQITGTEINNTGNIENRAYTPVSNNSTLIVELCASYGIGGYGEDTYKAYLYVGTSSTDLTTKIASSVQKWIEILGGGTRSGTLFPLMGFYKNNNNNTKYVIIYIDPVDTDDGFWLYRPNNGVNLKITEIAGQANL